MKKILGLSIVAILLLALVGGATFAYFSDTESSTGNTITAGTLNLTADESPATSGNWVLTSGADGANEFGTLSLLKPGDSGTVTWLLTNTGNIAGYLGITSTITPDEDSSNEPELVAIASNSDDDLGLGDLVGVKLTRTASSGGGTVYILGSADNYVPMSGLEAVLDAETSKTMAAGGTITYVLSWALPTDIMKAGTDGKFGEVPGEPPTNDDTVVDDNIIQGDSATIDITFTLTQNNPA